MVPGVVNFRDCGGVSSRFGGVVRHDRLYRAGTPGGAAQDGLGRLLAFNFRLIADLRYANERAETPSPWPPAYDGRILFHDGGQQAEAPHMALFRDGSMDEASAERMYVQFYRELPFDPLYRGLFSRILDCLPDLGGRALIHCSAGKDRTGALVALIHHALGVSRDEIVADYMKSRHNAELRALAAPMAKRLQKNFGVPVRVEVVAKLLDVEEQYLSVFLQEIENQCGSLDAYLDAAGLNHARREQLRARLLAG